MEAVHDTTDMQLTMVTIFLLVTTQHITYKVQK